MNRKEVEAVARAIAKDDDLDISDWPKLYQSRARAAIRALDRVRAERKKK